MRPDKRDAQVWVGEVGEIGQSGQTISIKCYQI